MPKDFKIKLTEEWQRVPKNYLRDCTVCGKAGTIIHVVRAKDKPYSRSGRLL